MKGPKSSTENKAQHEYLLTYTCFITSCFWCYPFRSMLVGWGFWVQCSKSAGMLLSLLHDKLIFLHSSCPASLTYARYVHPRQPKNGKSRLQHLVFKLDYVASPLLFLSSPESFHSLLSRMLLVRVDPHSSFSFSSVRFAVIITSKGRSC